MLGVELGSLLGSIEGACEGSPLGAGDGTPLCTLLGDDDKLGLILGLIST